MRCLAALALVLVLSACAAGPNTGPYNDPYEVQNRRIHDFNRGVDRALLRPSSNAYGVIPRPVRTGVSNFASNLDQPRVIVNGILQGQIEDAGHNFFRFLFNSILGIGGIFDPATGMGLEKRDTDFGETLHVWGAGEGAYIEIPVYGPSTQRDAVGLVVDTVMNPVRHSGLTNVQQRVVTAADGLSLLGDRHTFSDTIDSILYESADSYAQARTIYLQNRRFELGQQGTGGADDPYFDPYEDPYDQ